MPLVTSSIKSLEPYVPGKPLEEIERELGIVGAIKLASNENLLGPSPRAMEAVRLEVENIHFYPESKAPRLKLALAEHMKVSPREVVVGNGSSELIGTIVRTFTTPQDHAVISDYAFQLYKISLAASNVAVSSVPMQDMTHDLVAMKAAIKGNTKLVFIANPNNPTGTYNTRKEMLGFLTGLPPEVIVVLDEAYFEFAEPDDYANGLEFREVHDNLVVLRTFSKCYGLSGVRVGYGVAPELMVSYMDRVRQAFTVNRLGQAAAEAALTDTKYLQRTMAENRQNREWLNKQLAERGINCIPSQTNFLLFKVPGGGAKVTTDLLHEGVIVRPMGAYGLDEYIRVTVGRIGQCKAFMAAFDKVLGLK
jgi:histidinol-phosphate aminotransferase